MNNDQPNARRPLATRDTHLAKKLAVWIADTQFTPNGISMAGVVMAALAAIVFWATTATGPIMASVLFVLAAVFCQLRLLCNLLDGMVAVEGGKKTPDGPFWNEFPDRVSDVVILIGLGLAANMPVLSMVCAIGAILTAYVRELGVANDLDPDFSGPFAKPHRMAAVTVASLTAAAACVFWEIEQAQLVSQIALWIIAIGTGATLIRRCANCLAAMKNG